jgi:hypothetical protein
MHLHIHMYTYIYTYINIHTCTHTHTYLLMKLHTIRRKYISRGKWLAYGCVRFEGAVGLSAAGQIMPPGLVCEGLLIQPAAYIDRTHRQTGHTHRPDTQISETHIDIGHTYIHAYIHTYTGHTHRSDMCVYMRICVHITLYEMCEWSDGITKATSVGGVT